MAFDRQFHLRCIAYFREREQKTFNAITLLIIKFIDGGLSQRPDAPSHLLRLRNSEAVQHNLKIIRELEMNLKSPDLEPTEVEFWESSIQWVTKFPSRTARNIFNSFFCFFEGSIAKSWVLHLKLLVKWSNTSSTMQRRMDWEFWWTILLIDMPEDSLVWYIQVRN